MANTIQSVERPLELPLPYKLIGTEDAIVFIQGVGVHGDGWLPQTEKLSPFFQCLTFDNRGIGPTLASDVEITVEQMVRDTLTVMDAAGIGSAHIVGHSLGGSVALGLALSARSRVTSLSLLCTSSRGADATSLRWPMIWAGIRSRIGTRRMRAEAFLEMVMPPEYLAAEDHDALRKRLEQLFGRDLADSPPIVMQQLKALSAFDATDRLPELAGLPTLVLSAERDIIFPPCCGRKIAAGIPGARFVEIAGAAHAVTIQCAKEVNQELLEHLIAVGDSRE